MPTIYISGKVVVPAAGISSVTGKGGITATTAAGAVTVEIDGGFTTWTQLYTAATVSGAQVTAASVFDDGTAIIVTGAASPRDIELIVDTVGGDIISSGLTTVTNEGTAGAPSASSSTARTYQAFPSSASALKIFIFKGPFSGEDPHIQTITSSLASVVGVYFSPSGEFLLVTDGTGNVEMWQGA